MKIHILIDHDVSDASEDYLNVFATKKDLINRYIKLLFEKYPRHFKSTLENLQTKGDLNSSEREMLQIFLGMITFDESKIDLKEYFDEYDCGSSYVVKEL